MADEAHRRYHHRRGGAQRQNLQPDYGDVGPPVFNIDEAYASSRLGGGGGEGEQVPSSAPGRDAVSASLRPPPRGTTSSGGGNNNEYDPTSVPNSVAHAGMTPEAFDAYRKATEIEEREDMRKAAAVGQQQEGGANAAAGPAVVRPYIDRDAYIKDARNVEQLQQQHQQQNHPPLRSSLATDGAVMQQQQPPRIPGRRRVSPPHHHHLQPPPGGTNSGRTSPASGHQSGRSSPAATTATAASVRRYEPLENVHYGTIQKEEEATQRRRRSDESTGSDPNRRRRRNSGGGPGAAGDGNATVSSSAYDCAVASLSLPPTSSSDPMVTGWRGTNPTGLSLPTRREGINEGHMIEHLLAEGFPFGLANTLVKQCVLFPLRLWLIDNSGSMLGTDGHRIVQDGRNRNKVNTVDCSRWEEVGSTVMWHARLCSTLRAPTVFRLLNDPGRPHSQQLSVGESAGGGGASRSDGQRDVKAVRDTMRKSRPLGTSNLTQHLREIYDSVSIMSPDLTARGQKVAIVIVTDGLPTDDRGNESDDVSYDFIDMLRKFGGLPVWVIIRLSTDEERVVEFYNDIEQHKVMMPMLKQAQEEGQEEGQGEGQGQLDVDVLDDLIGEAKEVHGFNPWLTYSLTLHLCRETGMNMNVFDAIDERPLTPAEVLELCSLLFDVNDETWEALPDPNLDWTGFSRELRVVVSNEREQWNPVLGRATPWINFRELDRIYGRGGKPAGAGAASASSGGCACVVS